MKTQNEIIGHACSLSMKALLAAREGTVWLLENVRREGNWYHLEKLEAIYAIEDALVAWPGDAFCPII